MFERDNGALRPLVTKEQLRIMIDGLLCILSLSIVPVFMYEIIVKTGKMFWSLFTPGQQWLEIGIIIIGITILIIGKFVFDELSSIVIQNFEKLKQQNEEQRKKIAGLEDEVTELKKQMAEKDATIYSLEKKANGLCNVNVVEEYSNLENI